MTRQNQQNECAPSEDSDQPWHPPSLIRVFAVRMKKAWVLSYPLGAQRRLIRLGGLVRYKVFIVVAFGQEFSTFYLLCFHNFGIFLVELSKSYLSTLLKISMLTVILIMNYRIFRVQLFYGGIQQWWNNFEGSLYVCKNDV